MSQSWCWRVGVWFSHMATMIIGIYFVCCFASFANLVLLWHKRGMSHCADGPVALWEGGQQGSEASDIEGFIGPWLTVKWCFDRWVSEEVWSTCTARAKLRRWLNPGCWGQCGWQVGGDDVSWVSIRTLLWILDPRSCALACWCPKALTDKAKLTEVVSSEAMLLECPGRNWEQAEVALGRGLPFGLNLEESVR